jgi:Protein of unknown function (DUF2934)
MHTENKEGPTHEQITLRAYQIYLEHGFHPGNDIADWLAAEKELTETSARVDANSSSTDFVPSLRKHATA